MTARKMSILAFLFVRAWANRVFIWTFSFMIIPSLNFDIPLFPFGSFQYSTKTIWSEAKNSGSFLFHLFFITREEWTCCLPFISWIPKRSSHISKREVNLLISCHSYWYSHNETLLAHAHRLPNFKHKPIESFIKIHDFFR